MPASETDAWLTVSLVSLTTFGIASERGLPAQEGIPNFGRIDQTNYRGAQPDAAAIKNLHRLGIKTIIDLRNDRLRFRLCRPSDYMKLDPLWTKTTMRTIDQVRGLVKQGTLWRMTPEQLCSIQREIRTYWGFRERAVA